MKKPINQNTQVKLTLPLELAEKLRLQAKENGLTLSAYLRLLIITNHNQLNTKKILHQTKAKSTSTLTDVRSIENIF